MTALLTAPARELYAPDTIIAVSEDDDGLHASSPVIPSLPKPRSIAEAPVRFKIRLANDEGRRNSAGYLIQKMYGWRGYAASGPQAAPNRVTLMASDLEKALATITVGFDSPDGLMVEELYREDLAPLRSRGAHLCEFTKLAVDRNEQSKEVLAMMFHIAYMYARRIHRCSDLVIEVNPRHVRFYERMLGFRQLGPERLCPRVGAPAVLLWLDLSYAGSQIEAYGGLRERAGKVRSLYPFFFSSTEEEGIIGRLRAIG